MHFSCALIMFSMYCRAYILHNPQSLHKHLIINIFLISSWYSVCCIRHNQTQASESPYLPLCYDATKAFCLCLDLCLNRAFNWIHHCTEWNSSSRWAESGLCFVAGCHLYLPKCHLWSRTKIYLGVKFWSDTNVRGYSYSANIYGIYISGKQD